MAVQWLELPAFTAESPGSIPGQRTKITCAVWQKKKKVKKKSHSLIYEQVGCFYLWVIVFEWKYVFIFLGYIPKGRISGSDGNSMFNFLRNC